MSHLLPQADGWLPSWLLFVSILSVGNSIQSYITLTYTTQVYSNHIPKVSPHPEVTALQSRTFGTWTFLAAIVRIYAAYNISDPVLYQIALWTYVIAWGHFMSEWFVFGTAKWGRGLAGPMVVANFSLVWMVGQWGFYVK